jgi:L-fucose isomerase
LKPGILGHQETIASAVRKLGANPVVAEEIVFSPRMAVSEAKRLLSADLSSVIFNIPVFAFPNFAVLAADILHKPTAIMSPGEASLPGMGGMLAAAGALEQCGHKIERIWGPTDDNEVKGRLASFIRAAGALHSLRGQVYGQIGGRSIGMMTGVASSCAEWHRLFGVDIDHCDQSEILRISQEIPDKERERIVRWLEKNLGAVRYDKGKLTRENLKKQAACAAAVKRIIAEREFDFVGIKCHYDMSEYYCTQCLSAAFLPFMLDWDGARKPVACSCEADGEGALTMQVLQLLSGKPALFMDLRHHDVKKGLWTLCNCGGMSPYYSNRSANPRDNLKKCELLPVIPKYGGCGAHLGYVGCEGELSLARFGHDADGIVLHTFSGTAVRAGRNWTEASCPSWPHLFVSMDAGQKDILEYFNSNHIHAIEGSFLEELRLFAKFAGIKISAISKVKNKK